MAFFPSSLMASRTPRNRDPPCHSSGCVCRKRPHHRCVDAAACSRSSESTVRAPTRSGSVRSSMMVARPAAAARSKAAGKLVGTGHGLGAHSMRPRERREIGIGEVRGDGAARMAALLVDAHTGVHVVVEQEDDGRYPVASEAASRTDNSCVESGRTSSTRWPWTHPVGVNPRTAATKGPNHSWRSLTPKARPWRNGSWRRCARGKTVKLRGSKFARTRAVPVSTGRTAVVRDPYARWCGRGGTVRCAPIPIEGDYADIGIVNRVLLVCEAGPIILRIEHILTNMLNPQYHATFGSSLSTRGSII